MKKILLFTSLALILSVQATQAQEACIQVVQPAVDPNGICREFANPCIVPDTWKKIPVSSCEEVKSDSTGSSVDQVAERRQTRWKNALREKYSEKNAEIEEGKYKKQSNRPRIGSGQFTRIQNTPKSYEQNQKESTREKRTFNDKSYDSEYLAKRRYYRQNKGGYQQEGDATKEEREERRKARPAQRSRTDAIRTGELDNAPKLSERLKQRFSTGTRQRYRKGAYQRREKTKREPRTLEDIQLRRTYRGDISERKNANVGGVIQREDTE